MTDNSRDARPVRPEKPTAAKAHKRGAQVWMRLLAFVVVFAILTSLAIVTHGRFFGAEVEDSAERQAEKEEVAQTSEAVESQQGDELVINTTSLCKDVSGYGGTVPVKIFVRAGRIDSVQALPNSETPEFFEQLRAEGLTTVFNGKTLEEAAAMHPDAVSGATFSSRAFLANVAAGVAEAQKHDVRRGEESAAGGDRGLASGGKSGVSVVGICVLIVILMGALLPLFVHKPAYRLVQQLLNVGVLGFWGGTFIDYAMMENFVASGFTATLAWFTTLALLVVGFIYPLFGHSAHYCSWVCPYGALQDLAGHCSRRKLHLSPTLTRWLDRLRMALWLVLLCLLWAGWGASWIDYEIFTAFIVKSASWAVVGTGIGFVLLSVFITRPFCRFVCPTGSILKLTIKNR